MGFNTKKLVKSAWPIYIGAGAFVLCALFLPMYRLWGIAVGLVVALVAYGVSAKFVPDRAILVPAQEPPVNTGDAAADSLITEGKAAVRRLRSINDRIAEPTMTAQVNRMEIAATSIFDAIAEKPQKAANVRRFMNYYLPTSIKLLESYVKFNRTGAVHENLTKSLTEIRNSMGMIADAFEKQLDNLYEDEAMDISADIDVMEAILKSEGLADDPMTPGK